MNDPKDKNEDLFREVNERIEAISPTVPVAEPTMEFLCECDDAECQEKVNATCFYLCLAIFLSQGMFNITASQFTFITRVKR